MSRRDTMIIAVLVNAGLLAVLFMMAINSDDDKTSEPVEMTQAAVAVQIPEASQAEKPQTFIVESPASGDEVDNALKDFASAPTPQLVSLDDDGIDDEREEVMIEPLPEKIIVEAVVVKEASPKPTIEITVKNGDSLDKIARANKTTVSAIKQANQLKTDKLKIGQVLRLPVKSGETPSAPAVVAAPKPAEVKASTQSEAHYYTIKKGDNPWKIAKQFSMKVDDLLKLNALNEEKARNLKVGDKIRVR